MWQSQSEKTLSRLPKLSCDVCSPDIERFYDISYEIVERNDVLHATAASHPQGNKMLSAGRVVILRDGVSLILLITRY